MGPIVSPIPPAVIAIAAMKLLSFCSRPENLDSTLSIIRGTEGMVMVVAPNAIEQNPINEIGMDDSKDT